MTILVSRSVHPYQQLPDTAAAKHRTGDLGRVRLVAARFDHIFKLLRLHGFRDHYRPAYPDP
jgi:hypothetical protein